MLPKKGSIIAAVTLFLSLLNVYQHWPDWETNSFLVSIIGLIAVALYVLRVNFNRIVFYVWALCQLIVVRQKMPQVADGVVLNSDILNLTQGFKLALFLPFTLGNTHYEAGLNFVALFLVLLHRFLPSDDLKGKELSFFSYRHDNSLGVIFPVKGKVAGRVTLSGEDDWLLVQLNRAIQHEAAIINHVLIKRNDKKSIIPGKENQLVFFKLVPDPGMINEGNNDIMNFPLEVWALCK